MNLSNYFALNVDPSLALPGTYDYALVVLSYLVAALGSYAFLQFASRIAELRDSGLHFNWLAIGAVAMGGGIWAMHFIGMLAHILPIPVSYDPGITALSIVPAMLLRFLALSVRPAEMLMAEALVELLITSPVTVRSPPDTSKRDVLLTTIAESVVRLPVTVNTAAMLFVTGPLI